LLLQEDQEPWRGGRAVEGARLESVYTRNCIVGSNPIPSANLRAKTIFFLNISLTTFINILFNIYVLTNELNN
jgi:hypothetical protein